MKPFDLTAALKADRDDVGLRADFVRDLFCCGPHMLVRAIRFVCVIHHITSLAKSIQSSSGMIASHFFPSPRQMTTGFCFEPSQEAAA